MPKSQQQIDWLNNYYDENNINGDILEKSQAIADKYNKQFNTEGFVKGPKGRITMKDGGLAAQTVGGHMADRKRILDQQPRAIRNEEDEMKRLKAVSDIRTRPYVGDKMLLMEANNITHQQVKNHFEERARQEANRARKAGGQALIDFEESRSKKDTSNKYAAKMWTEYKHDKEGYLRKLRNGLISLKTGKAITGDSEEDFLYSALNPANGHIQSMSNGNRAGKGVAEVADEDSAESAKGANFMVHRKESERDIDNEYSSMAGSSQYPTRKGGLLRSSKDQAEYRTGNKRLGYTSGSMGKVDSQMSFFNNDFGGYGSSDEYTSESPAFYNDRLGTPQPKTKISKDDTFDIQTRSHGSGFVPPFKQQSISDAVHPKHSKSMHIGSQPSNQVDKWSNIGSVSLGESGTMGGRTLKRKCQPDRQLESKREAKQPQTQRLYNGLNLEGGVDDQEPNLVEEFFKCNNYMMQDIAMFHAHPYTHGDANREGLYEVSNNAAYPEGNLRNRSMANRENFPLDGTNHLTGDSAENAILIPDDDEAEGARENQSIGNETRCNEKLSTKEGDEPGYLAGASSVKGYTNAWYYQGRLRR
ncbi:hypothetical protein DSL72_000400 [Monilinia vaccinii-corymbosi]|uniref:Uncharacterized protein n=1 Tax=Monilinia vaccinii-corymbosi TaxID=61207 RepID=A0A8A3P1I4_9HELO|nr:hypothetical protein DSL72_000400 [Monilinia vaccinii-corymbosi]